MQIDMKRIDPYKNFDRISFGMTEEEVKKIVGVKEAVVTNKFLQESKLTDGAVDYFFYKEVLGRIDIHYQPDIFLQKIDIFGIADVGKDLASYKMRSKKDVVELSDMGILLLGFKAKDKTKRIVRAFSEAKKMAFQNYLNVV